MSAPTKKCQISQLLTDYRYTEGGQSEGGIGVYINVWARI